MRKKLGALLNLEDAGLDLDLFYNVSISNREVTLQGDMSFDIIKVLGERSGVILKTELDSGFLRGNFEVDEIKFRVTLT